MTAGKGLGGRHVVVTGGASGIGAAMVRAFAETGARVTFLDIAEAAGQALADDLGDRVCFEPVDLTDLDATRETMARIGARDPVEALVNGAANDTRHKTRDVTPESWRRTLALNLDHQFFCAQAVLPGMRARGRGVILNFGSLSFREGLVDAVGYVSAKAAIEGMTHSLAREAGPDGIRVNCLGAGLRAHRPAGREVADARAAPAGDGAPVPETLHRTRGYRRGRRLPVFRRRPGDHQSGGGRGRRLAVTG